MIVVGINSRKRSAKQFFMAVDRTTKEYFKSHYEKYGRPHYLQNKEQHHQRAKKHHRENLERQLWRSAKFRAEKSELEFDIEISDVVIPAVCPILQTPFVIGTMSAASIDRIDNTKGYIKGNIQVVSRRANTMKGDCDLDQLKLFAEWILKQ